MATKSVSFRVGVELAEAAQTKMAENGHVWADVVQTYLQAGSDAPPSKRALANAEALGHAKGRASAAVALADKIRAVDASAVRLAERLAETDRERADLLATAEIHVASTTDPKGVTPDERALSWARSVRAAQRLPFSPGETVSLNTQASEDQNAPAGATLERGPLNASRKPKPSKPPTD